LNAAVEAVARGEVDGLIVSKLDRLSRSVAQFSNLLERFRAKGWGLVILDLGIDTTTIMGEAMATMAATFAQVERRRIGERTKEALAVRRSQGVRLGRPTSAPAPVVARVRRMRSEGMTLQAICDVLNDESVPTPRGGQLWRPSSLTSLLK
jgi:DNA invertase Pin-like site-specific DNA recombinase